MTHSNSKITFGTPSPPPDENENPQVAEPQQTRPVRKVVRVSTPIAKPTPTAPGFAATGLMAPPDPSFIQRNAGMIGLAAIVVVTFVLGLATAFVMLGANGSSQQAEFSQPLVLEPVVSDAVIETATRAASPDLTDVGSAAPEMLDQIIVPDTLAAVVLAGLQPDVDAQQDGQNARVNEALRVLTLNKLRTLREGVLAGLFDIATVERDGVERVTLKTTNTEFTNGFEEGMLMQAANAGALDSALSLRTPSGGVDAHTMVFSLVQDSLMADQTEASTAAARTMSRKVFAASTARTADVGGVRVYTVQPGDSLAYIALQFFGKPSDYTRIQGANSDTLQSPDMIQVGQRLIIPS